jgi:hypothetical protein
MRLYGIAAIEEIERVENCTLNAEQRRIVMLEALDTEVYLDHKQIPTRWVGQTGPFLNMTFLEVYDIFVERILRRLPNWRTLPTFLRTELFQAEWRGDLGSSPKAVRLMQQGKWDASAQEFLDHREYQTTDREQIKRRIEAVSFAMALYDRQQT